MKHLFVRLAVTALWASTQPAVAADRTDQAPQKTEARVDGGQPQVLTLEKCVEASLQNFVFPAGTMYIPPQTVISLHEDPRGRQLLMVFKTDRVVRIQPGEIDSSRQFWLDYYRLPGSQPSRPRWAAATVAASVHEDRGEGRR